MFTFDLVLQFLLTLAIISAAVITGLYFMRRLTKGADGHGRLLHPVVLFVGLVVLLAVSAGVVAWQREQAADRLISFELDNMSTESNLLADTWTVADSLTSTVPVSPPPGSIASRLGTDLTPLEPGHYFASNIIPVQPGQELRYSLYASPTVERSNVEGHLQVRLLWYDTALSLISWNDSPVWPVEPLSIRVRGDGTTNVGDFFRVGKYVAPAGARRVRLEVRNTGAAHLTVHAAKLSAIGAYIEQNPNGTRGSVAFSFDWESAMGGPIHSRGMTTHDPTAAAQHGLKMRQGADWLMKLFNKYDIKGTFYATGYNFLDGNTDRRTFSEDPVYKWASPRNGWSGDHWLTHKWYGDDPFGTVESAPEWYFGDQTRALLGAGHEIAPHTFGHLYVRGSNPEELATDMDEWITASEAVGVPPATTFAFPWRSSNSLTPDFYDVLYSLGIRAVTRLYDRDLRDLYTISAVPTYTQMLVMPDFRLEASTANVVEEAAGEIIGLERGTQVLDEVIDRRGTSSFWTHPEQLADSTDFELVKRNWEGVVLDAAARRDRGLLWIGSVAEIIAYQRDVMSVTTRLEPGFLGLGDWTLEVHNDSGREIKGLTLTLPSEVTKASSTAIQVMTARLQDDKVILSPLGQPVFPARQLVFATLPPGMTSLALAWAEKQEPPR